MQNVHRRTRTRNGAGAEGGGPSEESAVCRWKTKASSWPLREKAKTPTLAARLDIAPWRRILGSSSNIVGLRLENKQIPPPRSCIAFTNFINQPCATQKCTAQIATAFIQPNSATTTTTTTRSNRTPKQTHKLSQSNRSLDHVHRGARRRVSNVQGAGQRFPRHPVHC